MTEPNDDTVAFEAHVPGWFRAGIARYLPLVAAFFIGNGTAGAVLYRAPSSEEIALLVSQSVAAQLEPLKASIKEIQKRTTELEEAYAAYSARIANIERRTMPTRNR